MQSWYDQEEDVLNIQLNDTPSWKSVELPNGIVIDVSEDGKILSIEIFNASTIFSGEVKKVIDQAKRANA
ncbi:MAG: DUF2283 domain-containing protein [Nanoarchaeota archaeon]